VPTRELKPKYLEALGEALCFGWLDGVRPARDDGLAAWKAA
jgi:hypothetical protein